MPDPKARAEALTGLGIYLRYKKWYIKFLYEFKNDVAVGLLGVLMGDQTFFNKMGSVSKDFFESQDAIKAKATTQVDISNETQADEILAKILTYFDWEMLEYYTKGGPVCGLILGKKAFVEAAASDSKTETLSEKEDEKEAPRSERPKLKQEAFINEKGQMLYWN